MLCADSSLTVKDVIKEFQPNGRLAQHRHGEARKLLINQLFQTFLPQKIQTSFRMERNENEINELK